MLQTIPPSVPTLNTEDLVIATFRNVKTSSFRGATLRAELINARIGKPLGVQFILEHCFKTLRTIDGSLIATIFTFALFIWMPMQMGPPNETNHSLKIDRPVTDVT